MSFFNSVFQYLYTFIVAIYLYSEHLHYNDSIHLYNYYNNKGTSREF